MIQCDGEVSVPLVAIPTFNFGRFRKMVPFTFNGCADIKEGWKAIMKLLARIETEEWVWEIWG